MSKQIFYEDGKFWFKRDGVDIIIGLSAETLDDIGEVKRISFPELEESYDRDDVIVEVSGEDDKAKLFTPMSGKISAINESLKEDPLLISDDPLNDGWLVRLEFSDESEFS